MWFEFPSKEDQFGSRQVRGITDRNGEVFGELRGSLPVKISQISGNCGFTPANGGENTNWVVYDAIFDKTGFLHLQLEKYYSKTVDVSQYYLTDLPRIDSVNLAYRNLKQKYAARNPLLDQDRDELYYMTFSKQQKRTYSQELKAEILLLDQRTLANKYLYDSLKTDPYNLKTVHCKKSMELDELWKQKHELTIALLENELKPQPALTSHFSKIMELSKTIGEKKLDFIYLEEMIREENSRKDKNPKIEVIEKEK